MFIVFLKFSAHRSQASSFMEGHKRCIARGFDDGVFLLTGSLQPNAGGAILVANTSRAELESRLAEDPFVAHDVVSAEVHEIDPSKAAPQLAFLVG